MEATRLSNLLSPHPLPHGTILPVDADDPRAEEPQLAIDWQVGMQSIRATEGWGGRRERYTCQLVMVGARTPRNSEHNSSLID